jgi:Tfp pilus assembly protein PilO
MDSNTLFPIIGVVCLLINTLIAIVAYKRSISTEDKKEMQTETDNIISEIDELKKIVNQNTSDISVLEERSKTEIKQLDRILDKLDELNRGQ